MKTLIFLGGEKPSLNLAQRAASRSDWIIAADSGYHAVFETGLVPDIVTGDFDSIGEIPKSGEFSVIRAPEQDATDFQKALRHVPSETNHVEILGGTGLRSDHFLTNLLIAAGMPLDLRVVFHDDTQSIYRITQNHPLQLSLNPGTILSLIPFVDCEGVSTSGCHWNLSNARMGPSDLLGQSNRADMEEVRIEMKKGILYAVVNHPDGLS